MERKNIIVFDIDGTLTLVGDRSNCLNQTPKNWGGYYERCDEDLPNWPVIWILRGLARLHHYHFIYVTGRRETTRQKTMDWLDKHDIVLQPEDLFMRKNHDLRLDHIIKPIMVAHLLPRIIMVFENRTQVVKMWRDLGITCLQVAKGAF